MSDFLKNTVGKAFKSKATKVGKKTAKTVARKVLLEQDLDASDIDRRLCRLRARSYNLERGLGMLDQRIDKLEGKLSRTFALNLERKAELREKIREMLHMQYAVYEYLGLLLDLSERPRRLSREELRFCHTCGKYLDELMDDSKVASLAAEVVYSRNASGYVTRMDGIKIQRLKRCDMGDVISRLKRYGAEGDEPVGCGDDPLGNAAEAGSAFFRPNAARGYSDSEGR